MTDRRSIRRPDHVIEVDNPRKVPFVELHGGRLQGVVSSKSSAQRVYVSYIEAETGDFYCQTNNNRQCGGLSRGPCKHLDRLVEAAIGRETRARVLSYLGLDPEGHENLQGATRLIRHLDGQQREQEDSEVFSRFLDDLQYLEREGTDEPVPEMSWFTT